MRIHSYWATVPEMIPEDELRLSILWADRWSAAGWEPFVLNEWHARQHPLFPEFDKAISALPSVNPASYERACFLRWLALAQVGGRFMSDFDVIPYPHATDGKGYPFEWHSLTGQQTNKLQMFQRVSPSCVHASKEVCEKLCRLFMAGKYGQREINGKPHFSDQYAIEDIGLAFPELIERHDEVKGYCDDHWETATMVHYSNSSMSPRDKVPRWKHIPDLRK